MHDSGPRHFILGRKQNESVRVFKYLLRHLSLQSQLPRFNRRLKRPHLPGRRQSKFNPNIPQFSVGAVIGEFVTVGLDGALTGALVGGFIGIFTGIGTGIGTLVGALVGAFIGTGTGGATMVGAGIEIGTFTGRKMGALLGALVG